ncbi:hypothetical protein K402DRAFT_459287 [Aulographum hederae CBS 113979]|uniref:Amidoligase enzyme n=1 Tax=Aulographum hederae CBS 113979 TaxID=1176131 RepID=A0A6G1HGE5_9PEZI|nr:hypothetical protein K402DRAFT_459287 [Aulographum hederae CBS 113979]
MTTSLPLTFGMEIEAILAFHQDEMIGYINRNIKGASLVKTISDGDRTKQSTVNGARAYKDEPLQLAQELLSRTSGTPKTIVHYSEDHKKPTAYSSWGIHADETLAGLPKGELLRTSNGKIDEKTQENWDSYGIEIVSPPFSSIRSCSAQLKKILDTIQESHSHGLTTTKDCGLHVHVGLPGSMELPLGTMQQLAYLVVVFEGEIERLNHPDRRLSAAPVHVVPQFRSNREAFYEEGEDDPVTRTYRDEESGTMKEGQFVSTCRPLAKIRESLFETVSSDPEPLQCLLTFIGQLKDPIVNWSYLVRESGPRTLEFRQHTASIDPIEISLWVVFCTSLVQLAHKYATTSEECPIQSWEQDSQITLSNLMEPMGLDDSVRMYYEDKVAEYDALWRPYEPYEDDFDLGMDSPIEGEAGEPAGTNPQAESHLGGHTETMRSAKPTHTLVRKDLMMDLSWSKLILFLAF